MLQPVQLSHTQTGERLILYHAPLIGQLVASGRWDVHLSAVPGNRRSPAHAEERSVTAVGLDPDVAQLLVLQGIHTPADIRSKTDAQLLRIGGVRAADVQTLRAWAT
jgi:hypothetical protein